MLTLGIKGLILKSIAVCTLLLNFNLLFQIIQVKILDKKGQKSIVVELFNINAKPRLAEQPGPRSLASLDYKVKI